MNNKGFTLVEILGVVVILSLLLLILAPPVINQISGKKDHVGGVQEQLIKDAADLYFDADDGTCVNVQELIDRGYLGQDFYEDNSEDYKNKSVRKTGDKIYNISNSKC